MAPRRRRWGLVQFQAEVTLYRETLAASDSRILAVQGHSLGFPMVHRWIAARGLAMTGEAGEGQADNLGLPPKM